MTQGATGWGLDPQNTPASSVALRSDMMMTCYESARHIRGEWRADAFAGVSSDGPLALGRRRLDGAVHGPG